MKVVETGLPGCVVIDPAVWGDARGFFYEAWNAERFGALGLPTQFVQSNVSSSSRGVLRGLHYQWPNPQGKLVSVLEGEVYDVAVDIRRGSPTFGQATGVVLSADNKRHFWIPEGFAHGFAVLSDRALFSYLCTATFDKAADAGIRWNDAALAIDWPIGHPSLSEKDANAPFLATCRKIACRSTRQSISLEAHTMKLLLLGGDGQLGQRLMQSLAPLGEVVATTLGGTLVDGTACERLDLTDLDAIAPLIERIAPDVVVNATAHTAVDKAESEPDLAHRINADAPARIAAACAARDAWLVHYSTDYVFDGQGTQPYRETDPDRAAQRLRAKQARRRGSDRAQRRASPDLPHGVGVRRPRSQLPAHHAAGGRRTRRIARRRRPGRHADACVVARRHHGGDPPAPDATQRAVASHRDRPHELARVCHRDLRRRGATWTAGEVAPASSRSPRPNTRRLPRAPRFRSWTRPRSSPTSASRCRSGAWPSVKRWIASPAPEPAAASAVI
jgi:dTDP-4-dehydrorhamnose 3,5-epimerase